MVGAQVKEGALSKLYSNVMDAPNCLKTRRNSGRAHPGVLILIEYLGLGVENIRGGKFKYLDSMNQITTVRQFPL